MPRMACLLPGSACSLHDVVGIAGVDVGYCLLFMVPGVS
jgi:hypothetical protein